MYVGIFEDFERVKKILASRGQTSVDENFVFELLEDLKAVDVVIEVLLGTPRQPGSESIEWHDDSTGMSKNSELEQSLGGIGEEIVETTYDSDQIQVLERYVVVEDSASTIQENCRNKEVKEDNSVQIIGDDIVIDPQLSDLTGRYKIKQRNVDQKNIEVCDLTSEVSNESDESENYYYDDSWDGPIEQRPSPPLMSPSQLRGLTSSPIANNQMEDRMNHTMLEENNNDPNNNLDDIQMVEQNRSSSATTDLSSISSKQPVSVNNSKIMKPNEESLRSPKPGCSKDSYYTEFHRSPFKNQDQQIEDPVKICTPKIKMTPKNDEKITSEDKNQMQTSKSDVAQSREHNIQLESSLENEATLIKKLLPQLTYASVLEALSANKLAINRVDMALWNLLPDEKPTPILLVKRKQTEGNGSDASAVKKVCFTATEQTIALSETATKYLDTDGNTIIPLIAKTSDKKTEITTMSEEAPGSCELGFSKQSSNKCQSNNPDFDQNRVWQSSKTDATIAAMEVDLESSITSGQLAVESIGQGTVKSSWDIQPLNLSFKSGKAYGIIKPAKFRLSGSVDKSPKKPVLSAAKLKLHDSPSRELMAETSKIFPCLQMVPSKLDHVVSQNLSKTGIALNRAVPNPGLMKSEVPMWNEVPVGGSLVTCHKAPLIYPYTAIDQQIVGVPNASKVSKIVTVASTSLIGQEPMENSGAITTIEIPASTSTTDSITISGMIKSDSDGVMNIGIPAITVNSLTQTKMERPEPVEMDVLKNVDSLDMAGPSSKNGSLDVAGPSSKIVRLDIAGPASKNLDIAGTTSIPMTSMYSAGVAAENGPPFNTFDDFYEQFKRDRRNSTHSMASNAFALMYGKSQHCSRMRMLEHVPTIAIKELFPKAVTSKHSKKRSESNRQNIPLAQRNTEEVSKTLKNSIEFRNLYNPLRNIFPDVDSEYINGLCIRALTEKRTLEMLIEKLLESGVRHPRIINPQPEPTQWSVDDQYEHLMEIFPNACPMFLRDFAEKNYDKPEIIKEFVQKMLETHEYPTKADYLKRIKITEQQLQYTTNFNVEKFLEIFPEPFAHFENPKRDQEYNLIAFEFLKSHFCRNKVNTILREYSRRSKCNVSLAAKNLELIGSDMKSKRCTTVMPTEDIPMLQEFAFIRHKPEIRQYMKEQKEREEREFKQLKDNKELLECQCCFDGECMPSKCSTCSEGHIFCNSCIVTGTETKIGEGQTQFPCFAECKGEFVLGVLQNVLKPTIFSILLQKQQEAEVKAAGLDGLVACPFCHFASIPPPQDKVFKCLNPECMKETCRLCKQLNHIPLRCDEVTKEEALHYLEEKMTQALVRKCYSCNRPFFKDEGCNKMLCICGASMCYICGEPVKDYGHFNGQGSKRTDLCPLWSDNQLLNAQTVREVAKKAQEEILHQNPNLKLDAQALLPKLPKATRGPHQDIPNGNMLPVHAHRAGGRIPP